jgi:hypothetical protein
LVCNEIFAVEKSIVFLIFCEFVYAINQVYNGLMRCHEGPIMALVMEEFIKWCGLFNVTSAIDGTHISIARPQGAHATYYYYHKIGGYTIIAQVVIDYNKRYIDVFVGLPCLVNDSRIFCECGLYKKAQHMGLFDITKGSQHGFPL